VGRGQVAEQIENVTYDKLVISGEGVFEISGECKLHSVIVGKAVSGESFSIFDASSGSVLSNDGVLVGRNYCNPLMTPVVLEYDVQCNSGLAIIVSGAQYLSVMYKR